jgi:hypothetical protein
MRGLIRASRGTIGAAMLLGAVRLGAVHALEPASGEAAAILDCERRLCTMLQQREAKGEDLTCELSKTWVRNVIKSADQPTVKWGFGDARCSIRIQISRAQVADALTARGTDYKLWIPPHTATCLVEIDGQARTLTATLAPKLEIRDGRVEKIWVNLTHLDGPTAVKATLWTAARLADNVGIFQRPMIKSVNRFITTTCPKKYPLAAATAVQRK